jgi:hypothetical protein
MDQGITPILLSLVEVPRHHQIKGPTLLRKTKMLNSLRTARVMMPIHRHPARLTPRTQTSLLNHHFQTGNWVLSRAETHKAPRLRHKTLTELVKSHVPRPKATQVQDKIHHLLPTQTQTMEPLIARQTKHRQVQIANLPIFHQDPQSPTLDTEQQVDSRLLDLLQILETVTAALVIRAILVPTLLLDRPIGLPIRGRRVATMPAHQDLQVMTPLGNPPHLALFPTRMVEVFLAPTMVKVLTVATSLDLDLIKWLDLDLIKWLDLVPETHQKLS